MAKIEIDRSPEMMRQYWVVEYHGRDPFRVLHVVTKPRGEKGAYTELTSLNGFRRRCTKRLSKHYDKDIKAFRARQAKDPAARMVYTSHAVWYDVRDAIQWQADAYVDAALATLDSNACAPVVEVGGVFDLYAAIGYDHRADRYHPTAPASARHT